MTKKGRHTMPDLPRSGPGSLFVGLVVVATILAPGSGELGAEVTGTLRIHDLESEIFGNMRKIRVWLPPGYSEEGEGEETYPVLYLNDGQNLFDAETSVSGSHEWGVDETVAELIGRGEIQPLVVVGIDNAGRRGRSREYLPYPDEFLEPPEPDPKGTLYDDFLAEDVLPFVESRYRVARDSRGRALGGSSYGALAALYVATVRPGLFSALLLESPSFYVDGDRVLREADPERLGVERIYLGVGTNEIGEKGCPEDRPVNLEAVDGVRKAAALFRRAGLRDGEELEVLVEPCGEHGEKAWARRLPEALGFLFGP